MCIKLSESEKKIKKLLDNGSSAAEMAKELNLKESSVKTYLRRLKKKLSLYIPKESDSAPVEKKDIERPESEKKIKKLLDNGSSAAEMANIERPKSESELKKAISNLAVEGTLPERVEELKSMVCKLCPQPHSCTSCPTKMILDKYLYLDPEESELDVEVNTVCAISSKVQFLLSQLKKTCAEKHKDIINDIIKNVRSIQNRAQHMEKRLKKYRNAIESLGFSRIR